jgi:hypothetical protein
MDLSEGLAVLLRVWPVTIVLGAGCSVLAACCRCAVAEAAARFSARLYVANVEARAEVREEWLRYMQDMTPAERSSHAGSLLWMGLRRRVAEGRRRTSGAAGDGSPSLARRAIQTGLAALGAVVLPVAMVYATAQAPRTDNPASGRTSAGVLGAQLDLVQARANAEASAFRRQADAAVPAVVVVPTTGSPSATDTSP